MDVISFIVNIVSIIGMITIATVVVSGNNSKSKLFFGLFIYTACLWLIIQYVVQSFALGGELGLKLIQFDSAIPFVFSFFFFCFIREYINKSISKKIFIVSTLFFGVELFLNMSNRMIQTAWGEPAGIVIEKSTDIYMIYIAIVGLLFLAGIIQLLKTTVNNRSIRDKFRDRLLFIGFLQAVIIAVVDAIFFSSSAVVQITTPISLLIMSIFVGFAIVKYQFFDIKSAIMRTAAYALSLISLAAIYFGLAYLTSMIMFNGQSSQAVSVNPVNIILALLLAFIFQPVKKFFDKVTNRIFYKDNYNTDDFFAKLNKILGYSTDLRGLLERTATEIGQTLKGEQAFFFINTKDGHFITAGTPKHKQLPKCDADQFSTVTKTNNGVIIASLLEDTDPIKRLMISHRIELVLPLVQDSLTIGYLCLGDHRTSSYTNRDIRVLLTISNELVIAIQNALAVQEIREFNVTLQQRITNATEELRASNRMLRQLDKAKDEFVSMASHQLRTPLTSVKGYISMLIDGDAGKVSEQQKILLDEAYNSSERMVNLINDFLNVSRIQTGKFILEKTSIDLSQLVSQEIDSLQASATSRNIKFIYDQPKDFPMVNIDESKIRQVVMNFLDNSIYYSPDGTSVEIKLSTDDDEAILAIKDSGIGVPINERGQLFTKFYRASNARKKRPDGTGVGLYLAKKIITAHDGKVIFESVLGKGSTFGFRLPLN